MHRINNYSEILLAATKPAINKQRQLQLKIDKALKRACDRAVKASLASFKGAKVDSPVKSRSPKANNVTIETKHKPITKPKITNKPSGSKLLTTKELKFLDTQNLTIDDVYDGRHERRPDYGRNAKKLGKPIVIGSKCKLQGHRLRTRSGHCIQCHPSKIAYSSRHSEAAELYIAGSFSSKLLKVGISKNIAQREKSLNGSNYAGVSDWKILGSIYIKKAGNIEGTIDQKLKKYKTDRYYSKQGARQKASEVYKTSFTKLSKKVAEVLSANITSRSKIKFVWNYKKTDLTARFK